MVRTSKGNARMMIACLAVIAIVILAAIAVVGDQEKGRVTIGWIVGSPIGDGYGVILHTTDGVHWARQGSNGTVPDVVLSDIRAIDSQTAWAVGSSEGGYGTILRTDDGGNSWVRQGDASLPNVSLIGIGVVNRNVAWAAGENGTILVTNNAGANWTVQAAPDHLTQAPLFVVAAIDAMNAWVVGDIDSGYATIFRTTDGGQNWVRQGTYETIMTPGLIDICAVDKQTAWAVGPDQTIIKTTDGGEHWVIQHTTAPSYGWHINGICAMDINNAWAAVDFDYLMRTTNGGGNWTEFHIPASVGVGFYLIDVSALDMNTLWVTGVPFSANPQRGEILHTTDGGATWQNQTSPVNTNLRRISFVNSPK